MEAAKRNVIGVEKISLEVMRNLHDQSDKMKDINVKITDLNSGIDGSSSLLNRMLNLQKKNKIIITVFAIILILLLSSVIIFKLI